jgi:serine/threonine protein phosphatase PrpC
VDLRTLFDRLDRHRSRGKAPTVDREEPQRSPSSSTSAAPPSSSGAGAEAEKAQAGISAEDVARSTLCLVLATDGVWDNWTYEDVCRFVMDASCLGAVGAGPDGAKRVTVSFMQRNALYAKRNFGSSADNATGIVLYLSMDPQFPAL